MNTKSPAPARSTLTPRTSHPPAPQVQQRRHPRVPVQPGVWQGGQGRRGADLQVQVGKEWVGKVWVGEEWVREGGGVRRQGGPEVGGCGAVAGHNKRGGSRAFGNRASLKGVPGLVPLPYWLPGSLALPQGCKGARAFPPPTHSRSRHLAFLAALNITVPYRAMPPAPPLPLLCAAGWATPTACPPR